MSKKNKKRNHSNEHKKPKNSLSVEHTDVIVAPVVARATDVQNREEVSNIDESVTDAYLKGSKESQKKVEKKEVEKKAIAQKNPYGGHSTHSHTNQVCQTPQLRKKVKNLMSLLIIASGFAAGTLFIDLAQFFTQRGLSARALDEARIVSYDGATWVKYDEPRVSVDVFGSKENSAETKKQIDGLLSALSYSIPTLEARIVDVDSEVGASRARDLDIAYAPAMHFSASLSESPYYKASSDLFTVRSDGTYLLQMDVMDISIDHFLEAPRVDTGAVIGLNDALHEVVMFENFLCDTCTDIHDVLSAFQVQNPALLKIVYKNIPSALEEASKDAAMAGYCAYAQGSYEQYAKILFTNSAWKTVDSELRRDLFIRYAGFLPELDVEAMKSCYTLREYDGQLVTDITEANRLGIVEVPTVFVDGVALRESAEDDLSVMLENVLETLLAESLEDKAVTL